MHPVKMAAVSVRIMRVLFFGHTGFNKRECIRRLAEKCLSEADLPPDIENIRSMAHLRVLHLENYIVQNTAGDYISYLDQFNSRQQSTVWDQSWDALERDLAQSGSEHAFISLHATYFRKNRFFSLLDFDRLRRFDPDVILTLIDDVHDCWYRIQEREKVQPRGTNLRVRDLLLWRTVEVMAGEFFKNGLSVPHYVLAVNKVDPIIRTAIGPC